MQLVPWEKEPPISHWLAIFKGPENDFKTFLKRWFEWRGGLDLSIAPLSLEAVPWIDIDTKPVSAYAVTINKLPAYFLVGRWTQDRHWRLFYKSEDKILATEELAGEAAPAQTITAAPHGIYLPWGFLTKESPPDKSKHDEIVLLLPDSNESSRRITLVTETHFSDISSLPDLQTVFSGREGTIGPSVTTDAAPVNSSTYVLPLRLVTAREDEQTVSPQERINRLQREVNRMQEQLDMLRWWSEAPEVPVRLNIYPETSSSEYGSFWELRNWFASASDQAIEQFSHLRIALDSLKGDFPQGALHLVRPTRFETEPTATLPRARKEFSFLLDQRWKRKGRMVFVPEGHELWPPPPWNNGHVTDLLTRCLWEGASVYDTLILLRMVDGREFRFTVGGFQPLARQVKALNFKVAITKAEYVNDPANSNGFETLAARCRQDVQQHIGSHAEQIKAVLDELWSDERGDLETYTRQVREALEQISKIVKINNQLNTFSNTNWNVWSDFREQVLRLDEQMLPTERNGLKSQLQMLTTIRMQLSTLWRNDTQENRQQVATSLKDLARKVLDRR